LSGEHWSVAILAALTAALELGVSQETCAEVIARFGAAFNRMSLHELADGRQFVLDSWKAPYWGLPACLEFLKSVTAPRKTVIFGAISDYHGSPKVRYEQAVKWALAVADRVLVVGPEASRVRRLRKSDFADRVMEIYSLNAAAQLLKNDVVDGEVIYIKASRADHLERLFHAQFTDLSCWRDRCGRKSSCIHCRRLLKRRIRTVGGYSRLPWLSREHSKPT
jgi:UDP-N-acetylmuramoyl-tripeptide--D-alanyl-D-alanine ligase